MNNLISLFPETTPISLSEKHCRILKRLLEEDNLFQSELIKSMKIDKTTVSEIISDLKALGWCQIINYPNEKNYLRINKKKEIRLFLDNWDSLGKCIFLRPHNIILQGVVQFNEQEKINVITKLSQLEGVKLSPSYLKNNTQYSLYTPYGTITLFQKGTCIKFNLESFVLPLKKEDIEYMKDYIMNGINSRFINILNMIENVCKGKIVISKSYCLKELHLGLISKKDIHKIMRVEDMLKQNRLISDNSIYGVDEIESKGDIDSVVGDISSFINDCIVNKIDFRQKLENPVEDLFEINDNSTQEKNLPIPLKEIEPIFLTNTEEANIIK